MELQTYRIDTVSLVRRRRVSLALEDVAQVSAAVAADYFRSLHAKRAVCVSGDGAGNAVEVRRPATAGFKFMVRLVERCVAAGACVHASRWLMLVVLAGKWGFGTLFSEDAELFCYEQLVYQVFTSISKRGWRNALVFQESKRTWIQHCTPLIGGPLVGVRHFF